MIPVSKIRIKYLQVPKYTSLLSFLVISDVLGSVIPNKTTFTNYCHNFTAPQDLWNPLSKAVYCEFHGPGGHRKRILSSFETLWYIHHLLQDIVTGPLAMACLTQWHNCVIDNSQNHLILFLFIFYLTYSYIGQTIQLSCSTMVPCYKGKYVNMETHVHNLSYKSYIKTTISW